MMCRGEPFFEHLAQDWQFSERKKTMWEKQHCRHQGQWRRRGRRCSRCRSRESSLTACDGDHGEAGCPPAAHGGPRRSRYLPIARGRDPTPEQVNVWRRLWPCGQPVLEQAPARTCRPVERQEPTPEQVCWQGLWLCGGPTLEQPVP